jgi:hypothetical protein
MIVNQNADKELNFDFGKSKSGQDWNIINDGVMGGLSQSKATLLDNSMFFEGNISLENNGGFASVRCPRGKYDLSDYKNVKIRFKSTGRAFAIVLENSTLFYRQNYKHIFESNTNKWVEMTIPLNEFKEYTLGKETGKLLTQKVQSEIIRIGFILIDKKEGPFEIEVDYLNFK